MRDITIQKVKLQNKMKFTRKKKQITNFYFFLKRKINNNKNYCDYLIKKIKTKILKIN